MWEVLEMRGTSLKMSVWERALRSGMAGFGCNPVSRCHVLLWCLWSGINKMDIPIQICPKNHCIQQVPDILFYLVNIIGHWILVQQDGWTIRQCFQHALTLSTLSTNLIQSWSNFAQKPLPSTSSSYIFFVVVDKCNLPMNPGTPRWLDI